MAALPTQIYTALLLIIPSVLTRLQVACEDFRIGKTEVPRSCWITPTLKAAVSKFPREDASGCARGVSRKVLGLFMVVGETAIIIHGIFFCREALPLYSGPSPPSTLWLLVLRGTSPCLPLLLRYLRRACATGSTQFPASSPLTRLPSLPSSPPPKHGPKPPSTKPFMPPSASSRPLAILARMPLTAPFS
ncbi:hypothetical protein B0T25DRAFT_529606 [Lasiosphaeria hispida]|uniref:Uncharacterized protein n=1 Tax=Lasiosphaeria hispida TaxID=260671 RepID=A0AAJ0HX39_9PEZI|nr:hypothetical protein B0T25DRAFT_529606 [Lasiosphaeria hispida]